MCVQRCCLFENVISRCLPSYYKIYLLRIVNCGNKEPCRRFGQQIDHFDLNRHSLVCTLLKWAWTGQMYIPPCLLICLRAWLSSSGKLMQMHMVIEVWYVSSHVSNIWGKCISPLLHLEIAFSLYFVWSFCGNSKHYYIIRFSVTDKVCNW